MVAKRIFLSILLSFIICSSIYPKTASKIAKSSFSSVVLIASQDKYGQPVSYGSGFFVEKDVIATNYHVIKGSSSAFLRIVGKKEKHNIIGYVGIDKSRDLILLKVSAANEPILSMADNRKLEIGDEVFVIGNPLGLEGTFSEGIVSGIRQVDSDTILQITAPISPGSSGGPVLNSTGEVIGVAFATFQGGQNLNFAIPSRYLISLLCDLHPTTQLSGLLESEETSIFDNFGKSNIEGVIGEKFKWVTGLTYDGSFSFTIRNLLNRSIKDIHCIIIFYDYDNKPIDYIIINYYFLIPPKLAKRVPATVGMEVKKMITPRDPDSEYLTQLKPATKVEFRILSFNIAD